LLDSPPALNQSSLRSTVSSGDFTKTLTPGSISVSDGRFISYSSNSLPATAKMPTRSELATEAEIVEGASLGDRAHREPARLESAAAQP